MSANQEGSNFESQREDLLRLIREQTNPELLEEIKLVLSLSEESPAKFDYVASYTGTADAHARGN